jgi:UTP--glucose-1-phosphate uridylyltransferase
VTVKKAVITAAGRDQRALPLQTLIDQDGEEKPVLQMLVEQALAAKVEEVCVVSWPGDEGRYLQAAGKWAGRVRFLAQPQPLGYGHAVYCAREFTGGEAFLHMVGDHLYVSQQGQGCARQVTELAVAEECAVSAVQPTRETLLKQYGAVGGRLAAGRQDVYRVETVLEKPTPTEAEQKLIVPGLRAGHYLCFFGMHVLTPAVMEILEQRLAAAPDGPVTLSSALAELARREQYLALEVIGKRYDIGARYGLLTAQLAVALSGQDRAEVLARVVEVLADRELGR